MLFTGKRFRSIPKTQTAKFVFKNTLFQNLESGGYTQFGFSGSGKTFLLKYTNSGLFSPSGKLLCGNQDGDPWDIELFANTGTYRLNIDDEAVIGNQPRTPFKIDAFYIYPSGQKCSTDLEIYTAPIDYSITVPDAFETQTSFLGKISNNTNNVDFKVFSYTLDYDNSNSNVFTGSVSGNVTGGNWLSFIFNDITSKRGDENVGFTLTLQTNFGVVSEHLNINRVSGYADEYFNLLKTSNNIIIEPVFSGVSGLNSFQFISSTLTDDLFWSYLAYSGDSVEIEKDMEISFVPVTPALNSYYSTRYITGFQITDTGKYSTCPTLEVTGYYYVESLDFTANSILFSSGCTGNIPLTFSSNNGIGKGGSGIASGEVVKYYGIFDSSSYLKITDIQVLNGGTGYTIAPKVTPNTGIYSSCYDVPATFGSQLTYEPFSVAPVMAPLAAYLSGEVFCSGVTGGNSYLNPYTPDFEYYVVVGVGITNPGFGYDTGNYKPLATFKRATGDIETDNASGKFVFYTGSGYYDFGSVWDVETGFVRETLYPLDYSDYFTPSLMLLEPTSSGALLAESHEYLYLEADLSGYNGKVVVPAGQNQFFARITFNSLDYTGNIVAKMKITAEDGEYIENFITGTNSFSSNLSLLKKNDFNLTPIPDNNEAISFFFDEYELDDFEYGTEDASTTFSLEDL